MRVDPRALRTEQARELARVQRSLAERVYDFCREVYRQNPPRFHLVDLQQHLAPKETDEDTAHRGAPDSPSRILRLLRQELRLDYTVVNRRASLYELLWVKGQQGSLF
jgi:hypothetical protein